MRILILFILLASCTSLETVPELNPKIFYRPDIKVKHNSKMYHGWGVLSNGDKTVFDLEITAPGEIDLLKISTCSRFDTDEPHGSIFRNGKKYKYTYAADPKDELSRACPLVIEAYEQGVKGRHSFAIFEIDAGRWTREKLPAYVKCNSRITKTNGVSMCVHMENKYQRVIFDKPVEMIEPLERCKIPIPNDNKVFVFKTPNRKCLYLFKELNGNRLHRHFSIGFEDIAVRRMK